MKFRVICSCGRESHLEMTKEGIVPHKCECGEETEGCNGSLELKGCSYSTIVGRAMWMIMDMDLDTANKIASSVQTLSGAEQIWFLEDAFDRFNWHYREDAYYCSEHDHHATRVILTAKG